MNTGKTIFAQVMEFLPLHEFRHCVRRYQGDYKTKSFSCLDQFLCMGFAQMTYRESLRDIETCLRAMQSKLYHMGIRGKISRSTLADANETRDWRIYADFAQALSQISLHSLYFHVCDARLRLGHPTNDFAIWFDEQLGLKDLAARVADLDPYLHTLETLRSLLLSLIRHELDRQLPVHA